MHLITLGLGLMLLPTGYALRCYVCDPGDTGGKCIEERQYCPNSSGKCAATTYRRYLGPTKYIEVTQKSCNGECVPNSLHFKNVIVTTQCCYTDLCNTMAPPVNAAPNGLKCYTCQDDDCSHILSCTGDQDHCHSLIDTDSEGNVVTMVGCASKGSCYLGLADGEKAVAWCCEGDLCNNAEFRAKSSRAKSSRSAAVSLTPIITTILASLLLVL